MTAFHAKLVLDLFFLSMEHCWAQYQQNDLIVHENQVAFNF